MAEYRLADKLLETSEGRDRLAELRARYVTVAEDARSEFVAKYAHLGSMSAALNDTAITAGRLLRTVTAQAADDIAAHRIYTVDEGTIATALEHHAENMDDRFVDLCERYFAIVDASAEAKAQRTERREARDRWTSGGFGLSAALQASAQAGAINAATGLLHGLRNAAEGAFNSFGDRRKMQALFDAAETRTLLADHIASVAIAGHEVVAELVNAGLQTPTYDVVTPDDRARARVLVTNVAAGRVPAPESRRSYSKR